jgi:ATPase subunit of ABC transporter with duplicated ATPase domains
MAGTLIARDLHKAHGAGTILAGVSVTVAPGDVLGVVGPNGAGKSTLLRLLAGVDAPDAGSVTLTAGTAGYLPQEPDRQPGETLAHYLARRTGVAAADARVQAASRAGVTGTPAFFVNGVQVVSPGEEGASMADLSKAIDAELAKG